MLDKLSKNRVFIVFLAAILILCTLVQNYIPGVYSMPDENGEIAESTEQTALSLLEERIAEIEDADTYMEVGKYVYEAVVNEEAGAAEGEAVTEKTEEAKTEKAEYVGKTAESVKTTEKSEVGETESVKKSTESAIKDKKEATSTEELSARIYPWSKLNDEELVKWVCSGKNDNYLKHIIENEKDEKASKALDARIYEIAGSEDYKTVSEYIYFLKNPEKEDQITESVGKSTESVKVGEKTGAAKAESVEKSTESVKVAEKTGAAKAESVEKSTESVKVAEKTGAAKAESVGKSTESVKVAEKTGAAKAESVEKSTESVKVGEKTGATKAESVGKSTESVKGVEKAGVTKTESVEKSTESVTAADIRYPWEGMTDEEFADWITGGEHTDYILRIIEEETEISEAEALRERIKSIQTEDLEKAVQERMKAVGGFKADSKGDNSNTTETEIFVTKTEIESLPLPEEIPENTFAWDYMTDEELAAWIFDGENDEYLEQIFEEEAKENSGAVTRTSEKKEALGNSTESDKSEKATEKDSLDKRIEAVEDEGLWERIKEYVHDLLFGKYEEITLTDKSTGVVITGELPENTELTVAELNEKQVEEYVEEGQTLTFAYDITLWVDGEEYQPENPVNVQITTDKEVGDEVTVQHVEVNHKTGEESICEVESDVDDEGNVVFEADGFSLYIGTYYDGDDFYINYADQKGFDVYLNYKDSDPISYTKNYVLQSNWNALRENKYFFVIARKGFRIDSISFTQSNNKTLISNAEQSIYSEDSSVTDRTRRIKLKGASTVFESRVSNSVWVHVKTRVISIVKIPYTGEGFSVCKVINQSTGVNNTDKDGNIYKNGNNYEYESDTNDSAQTITISVTPLVETGKRYYIKDVTVTNEDGSSSAASVNKESDGVYKITIPTGLTANQIVNVDAEPTFINIGTINSDNTLWMQPKGYSFYTDKSCSINTKIPSGNSPYSVINGLSNVTLYAKETEGMGYNIKSIGFTNKSNEVSANSSPTALKMDGVWEINFPQALIKDQIITVQTKRTGNIDLYIDKGNVTFTNSGYSGTNRIGEQISDTHIDTDTYTIHQTSGSDMTENNVVFTGEITGEYNVTLDGVNMGWSDTENDNSSKKGMICVSNDSSYLTKKVTLKLKNENIVRGIQYYASDTDSYLNITSADGDEKTDGSLYVPVKKNGTENIRNFVNSNAKYNHYNAGIGSVDSGTIENMTGLNIKGGTIQVLTTKGDNCTAIGAGGNGYCNMKITGGKVTAICNGTGAAIGGGIGYTSKGGNCDIEISGGEVYAENYGLIEDTNKTCTVGGVAIGGGSSFEAEGSLANVTISGGTIKAYAAYGNGIGSGNSAMKSTDKGTIVITGGNVTTNAIGGGSSESAAGGSADITASGTAVVTCIDYSKVTKTNFATATNYIGAYGIGGGTSKSGNGGSATVTVGGSAELNCNGGTIGGGTSKSGGSGGEATITINSGTLNSGKIGGGNAEGTASGNYGGKAVITVNSGALNATGGIGGGEASGAGNGGNAKIKVVGGTLDCASIGGGDSDSGTPGSVVGDVKEEYGLDISGSTAEVKSGKIGGGTNSSNNIGSATVKISGGKLIQGQFILSGSDCSFCSFEMSGGTIDNTALGTGKYTKAKDDGGAVYMSDSHGTVKISEGILKNCTAKNGGAVYMTGGSFELSGSGKIQNCKASSDGTAIDGNGGAIYLESGTVNISGGEVGASGAANKAENGGGIYLKSGKLNLSGGSIGYNEATIGGGTYLAGGTLNITGGSLEGNTVSDKGGGAYLNGGDFTLEGSSATIKNNKAKSGGGIYLDGGTPTLKSGSLEGNIATENGGGLYINKQNLKLELSSGATVTIKNNRAGYSNTASKTDTGEGKGGGVYIYAENGGNGKFEVPSTNNGSVEISGNKAKTSGGGVFIEKGIFDMNGSGVTLFNNESSNGGGVGLSYGSFNISNGCLGSSGKGNKANNGGGVYLYKGNMSISGDGSLGYNTANKGGGAYLYGGKITVSGGYVESNSAVAGGGVYLDKSAETNLVAEMTISGGLIRNNVATGTGGGAYLANADFEVKGGSLKENTAEYGGGAYLAGGSFKLNDANAKVESNKANKNGGGIYITGSSPELYKGDILNNTANQYGGGIYIDKRAVKLRPDDRVNIKSNTAADGGGIYIGGTDGNTDASFGVYSTCTGLILLDGNKATESGGGICIKNGEFNLDSEKIKIVSNTAVNGGGAAVLSGNANITGGIMGGDSSNPNTATYGGGLYVKGGTFTLNGTNAAVKNNQANYGGGIFLTGGKPNLLKGMISENSAKNGDGNGGGIYIYQQDVVLSPSGEVKITSNTAINGGGIYIGGTGTTQTNASFGVSKNCAGSVTLQENKADNNGGGVCINKGQFNLDSDKINLSGNKALNGGGVSVLDGNFTISDGEIGKENFENTAEKGGGVYVSGGTASINGGAVNYNSSKLGGGVYVSGGEALINSGVVKSNSSENEGGGVYVSGGKALINGGAVSNNNSKTDGGGVYVSGGDAVIKKGEVKSNISQKNGAGVAVCNGKLLMLSGDIASNTAIEGNGGGVYVNSSDTADVKILSGKISGNQAMKGAGLAVTGKCNVVIGVNHDHTAPFTYTTAGFTGEDFTEMTHSSCPEISGNLSGDVGGGIYLSGNSDSAHLNIYCVCEKNNQAECEKGLTDSESNFMMVEGGNLTVTTNALGADDGKAGNVKAEGNICVNGGACVIGGVMTNPIISGCMTVNVDKTGGSFSDNRPDSSDYYKLLYYENLDETAKYKAYQIQSGTSKIITGSLYSFLGHKITGWNTLQKPTAENPGVPYKIGDTYVFNGGSGSNEVGNLTLYAVLEPIKYTVHYNVNAPEGMEYSGTMADQQFVYDVEQKLTANGFKISGATFKGWKRTADGQTAEFSDCATVSNLSTEDGAVVQLYADWEGCEHNKTNYVYYTIENSQLIQHCKCGKHNTVISLLELADRQYNKNPLSGKLNYSPNEDSWIGSASNIKPVIIYQKKSGDTYTDLSSPTVAPTDAGEYRAIVKVSDGSGGYLELKDKSNNAIGEFTKTFKISKADQDAPEGLSCELSSDGKTLTVSVDNAKTDTGGVQFMMKYQANNGNWVYHTGKKNDSSSTETWVTGDSSGKYTFETNKELTTYYIYAKYVGNENYNASPVTNAISYTVNNARINVTYGEGITNTNIVDDSSNSRLKISFAIDSGYYMTTKAPVKATKTVSEASTAINPTVLNSTDYTEWSIPYADFTGSTEVTINISGAVKKAVPVTKQKAGQNFTDFNGDSSVNISQDAAYTVQMDFNEMKTSDYKESKLKFSSNIPKGTSIIMYSGKSYWYYNLSSSCNSIALSSFKRMGGSDSYRFSDSNSDTSFRFVIDFSRANSSEMLAENSTLVTSMEFTPRNVDTNNELSGKIPSLSVSTAAMDIKKRASLSLEVSNGTSGEIKNVKISYIDSEGSSEAFRDKEMSLVLTGKDTVIPADAIMVATINGSSIIYTMNKNKQFIIPLSEIRDIDKIELCLDTKAENLSAKDYNFTVDLRVAEKTESPLNGSKEQSIDNVKFTKAGYKPVSLKVTGDKRIYKVNDSITLNLSKENFDSNKYSLSAEMLEMDATAQDVSKAYVKTQDVEITDFTSTDRISLKGLEKGNYCLSVNVTPKGSNEIVLKVPYYFIIK